MEPECYVCNNPPLIFAIHEEALRRGHESDWRQVGDAGLYSVEVMFISRMALMQLVDFVKSGSQVALPMAA